MHKKSGEIVRTCLELATVVQLNVERNYLVAGAGQVVLGAILRQVRLLIPPSSNADHATIGDHAILRV